MKCRKLFSPKSKIEVTSWYVTEYISYYVKDGQISSFEKACAKVSDKAYGNFFLDKDKTIQNRQRFFLEIT